MTSSTSSTSSLASTTSPRSGKPKLPITSIPDMRFEQSYLASIRGFVHEVDKVAAEEMKEARHSEGEKHSHHHHHLIMASKSTDRGEPELWLGNLRIEWWPLLYLTLRDQIFSPIVQGAVFGVGGLALAQLRTYLRARRQTSR